MLAIKLTLLALCIVALTGCDEYIKPTEYHDFALVEYSPKAPLVEGAAGYSVSVNIDKATAHKLIDRHFEKHGTLRKGLIIAPPPQYPGDCRMSVLGHELWHVLRGLWHGNEATGEC